MPDPGYASLCFLSYKRPAFIKEAIRSAVENAGYPVEIIVHDDGSDTATQMELLDMLAGYELSHLILNPTGHNEGVGTSINRCFKIATGDPVIKLDQDMLYQPDWLLRTVGILRHDGAIGMFGFFKYHHEPVIWSDQRINVPTRGGYHYTRQFCGSGFALPRDIWDELGPLDQHLDAFNEDSNFMIKVRGAGYELALPDIDLATNRGFGIGPSTVVEEGMVVHKIHHGPFVIGDAREPLAAPVDDVGPQEGQGLGSDSTRTKVLRSITDFEPTPISTIADAAEVLGMQPVDAAEVFRSTEDEAGENENHLPPQGEVISPEFVQNGAIGRSFYDVPEGWPEGKPHVAGALTAPRPPERKFEVGVVITTCAGREDNLRRTVENLMKLDPELGERPACIVVVYDGCEPQGFDTPIPVYGTTIPKHGPGQEQPRNVGFRLLRRIAPECNYVWFLDSDLIFRLDILDALRDGFEAAEGDRILIAPYDWLPHGETAITPGLRNDPRWVSFDEHGPEKVLVHDLGAGLANFGGNLLWPVDRFERVGGFHPDLHHGRCEDGELGLRAASEGIPMSFVREARAWHVAHEVDWAAIQEKNTRDVPLINQIHPWVEGQGLLVTAQDGARFDFVCPECGAQVNSLEYWPHTAAHRQVAA